MAGSETNIANSIMIAASKTGATVFRNVRGLFLTLDGNRKVLAGLQCKGSSDLIGLQSITITEKDIGRKIAVFVALEIKTATGTASPEQKQFIEFVKNAGGIGGICRSEEEAVRLLS